MKRRLQWTTYPIQRLDEFAADWDVLNRETCNLPVLDSRTMKLLCAEFGSGREVLAVCRSQSDIAAVAILNRKTAASWETFQVGQAPLGAWLHRAQYELRDLLDTLIRAVPGICLLLGVTQQDPDIQARPAAAGRLKTIDYIETARVTISTSFEEYWRARGSNLRQNLKKQRNKLATRQTAVRLETVREPHSIGAAVADYGRLESAGWKGSEGTALHPDNAQGRFYKALFEHLAERAEATIYRYFFGDRLVASDLCVHRDGTLIVLKTAFDESEKSFSPSLLMKEEAFAGLFADGVTKRIEFYGKVLEWHRRWSEEIRVIYHINYFRWPWIGSMHARRHPV